jgi:hypothetical protein
MLRQESKTTDTSHLATFVWKPSNNKGKTLKEILSLVLIVPQRLIIFNEIWKLHRSAHGRSDEFANVQSTSELTMIPL